MYFCEIMKSHILLFLLACTLFANAQESIHQADWQQQADYAIKVSLNDKANYLFGFETITYTNNSPTTLNEIYIHLFPNAYKNHTTAFALQKINQGKTDFYNSNPIDYGYIDHLDFRSNGKKIEIIYIKNTPDNAILRLNEPLIPGQKITITTPFEVKIPYTFSRLGHVGQSFQISQWFPKISVFDVNGWNQFPYLDQGEFYSDYGNYDVEITLPKNYLVAATGNLQNSNEIKWLKQRAENKIKNIHEFADDETKTLRFTENNIHDFAFFADKRWCVASEDVQLPSGKKITAWAFDTVYDEALKGVGYIKKTLLYLSQHVGEYPYQTAKSCTGALVAGAGMEYPTVTIVGHQNEAEVVHEIGHNWFYGLLGSNERRYPWMDEGINTFYQLRICTEKESELPKFARFITGREFVNSNENLELLLGLANTTRGNDAPVSLHSMDYSEMNYGAIIYARAAMNINYLMQYLGPEVFDQCMQHYFKLWNHKHPLPGDIRNCFEKTSNKDLGWFFNGILIENQNYDIAISKIISEDQNRELEIHLRNNSGKAVAVPLKMISDSTSQIFWIDPFAHDTLIHLHNNFYNKAEVNDSSYLVETKTNNNYYLIQNKNHHAAPLELRYAAGLENKYHSTLFFTPLIAANASNKLMLGIALYNSTIIRKPFEFLLAPLFSFEKKNSNGYANVSYTFLTRKYIINVWSLGIKTAKFNAGTFENNRPMIYLKMQPYVQLNFTKPSNASHLDRFLRVDLTAISKQSEVDDDSIFSLEIKNPKAQFLTAIYQHSNSRILHPYDFRFLVERKLAKSHEVTFTKLTFKGKYQINYSNPKKKLRVDFFVGQVFYKNSAKKNEYNNFLSGENIYNDYKYWMPSINRNPGNLSTITYNEQGGIRSNVFAFNTSNLSATIKLRTHLPFTNAIRPYIDLGSYNGLFKDEHFHLIYTSGISIVILEDLLEINFPLAFTHQISFGSDKTYEVLPPLKFTQSKQINEIISTNKYRYLQTITILLNLEKMNPLNLLRSLSIMR